MTWTCEHIEERLSEYTDRLLAPAEREAFSEHLAGCRRCDALARRVASLTLAMHALEPLEPPGRLVHAILDKTTGGKLEPAGWRARLRWLWPTAQPRFAMGMVTVAMFLMVLTPSLGIRWGELEWADLKPANIYQSLDRGANLMYARGVKFVNELRVVYEIQNMLQPATETQREAAPDAKPGDEKQEEKPGNKTNRAREWEPIVLAALSTGLPGRNN